MKSVKKAIDDIYYNDAGFETLFGSRRSGCTYYEVRKLEEEVKFQKNRADVYKRCFEILLKRNKLMLKTLEDILTPDELKCFEDVKKLVNRLSDEDIKIMVKLLFGDKYDEIIDELKGE